MAKKVVRRRRAKRSAVVGWIVLFLGIIWMIFGSINCVGFCLPWGGVVVSVIGIVLITLRI